MKAVQVILQRDNDLEKNEISFLKAWEKDNFSIHMARDSLS